MRVLVACEFSQIVTAAFRARGHKAFSCDLLPTEGNPRWHIQGDAIEAAYDLPWDMMIAHLPCTHFTLAGARWFYDDRFPNKHRDRDRAIRVWKKLYKAPIVKKAFENPQPMKYVMDRIGRYQQKLQPWMFGDNEAKGICLWLDELPPPNSFGPCAAEADRSPRPSHGAGSRSRQGTQSLLPRCRPSDGRTVGMT